MINNAVVRKKRAIWVPMRKAVIDALLLGTLIVLILTFAGTGLFANAWLIIPVYALVYLIAFVLRLRQAAHASLIKNQEQDEASRELSSARTLNAVGIWKGNQKLM